MSENTNVVPANAPQQEQIEPTVLTLAEGTDYVLGRDGGDYVWITVENISIKIKREAEGVVVDCYPRGTENVEPIATTYAFYSEAQESIDADCDDEQRRRIAEDCALPETRRWNESAQREFA